MKLDLFKSKKALFYYAINFLVFVIVSELLLFFINEGIADGSREVKIIEYYALGAMLLSAVVCTLLSIYYLKGKVTLAFVVLTLSAGYSLKSFVELIKETILGGPLLYVYIVIFILSFAITFGLFLIKIFFFEAKYEPLALNILFTSFYFLFSFEHILLTIELILNIKTIQELNLMPLFISFAVFGTIKILTFSPLMKELSYTRKHKVEY